MTAALDAGQRTRLDRIVSRARHLLERDLADQAAGRFGIDPDGTMADEDALRLDSTGLTQRRELVEVIDHLRSEGDAPPAAVARLLRETAFTHLNRLLAIRIAEALGLLPPSLANGRSSQGFRDLLELAPFLAGDHTGGYWIYLKLCGDELAGDVPALFDPRNPLLALAPSPGALNDIIELLAEPDAESLWLAPDCLGWTYQFFNTADERRAMREGSAAPRNSRELAVRNQFFTPRYVVDFLVQNTLGRRLIDADPTSPLLDDLPLLIDPPSDRGEPVDLNDVSILDPACGSGHFLLAAYDVLERAWHHSGVDATEAAPSIVRSLWGIDIDPRCVQVAAAAVIFRARRSCPDGELPRPNIICARALPATATGLEQVLAALPENQRRLVEQITQAMADAPVLGSLLKIEERLASEVRGAAFGDGAAARGTLADALPRESLQVLEEELLASLGAVADSTTASPAERLLAAEAEDAGRFVHALQRRHDVVCMNPPFGEPVPATKPYLKAAYPWIPTRDYNLLAAFVGRGLGLCKVTGYVGAITSRAGMFLRTFEEWRSQVLLGHHLVALADLGHGVMEQALVEAAAYVVGARDAQPDDRAFFVRLLKDIDRPQGLASAISASRRGASDHRVYEVRLGDLHAVPGSPVAYWIGPSIRRLFLDQPALEGHGAEVRVGLQTGDDFRFVRAFWEVDPARIARSREETRAGKRWVPFAKGGEYSPYWADVHLVVDYGDDGLRLRDFPGSVIRNPQYYFRPGITWPERTTSGFGPRVLPEGCIFSHVGHGLFPSGSPWAMVGYLKTRLIDALVAASLGSAEETKSGSPAKRYSVGAVQRLPWIADLEAQQDFERIAQFVVHEHAIADRYRETARRFVAPAGLDQLVRGDSLDAATEARLSDEEDRALRILAASLELETRLHEVAGLSHEAVKYLADELGEHPAAYPNKAPGDDAIKGLYGVGMEALIDEALLEKGGSRAIANLTFFADRRLEVSSHALGCSPAVIVERRRSLGLIPPEQRSAIATDVMSYLVGVSFGRWDLRVGHGDRPIPPVPGPFDPVPVHAPGALPDDGALRSELQEGQGGVLSVHAPTVLVDEPGHPSDIEKAVVRAATALVGDPDRLFADLLTRLPGATVRSHLRKAFYKEHLARYSKSRRKSPIYWPLYVPSAAWGVWVYAPTFSREALFAVARASAERLDRAETEIRRLQRECDSGRGGRGAREVADALESEEKLAEELRRFREEAERVSGLGWEPDLNDGIVLCAAPLADLFPAWKAASSAREEIKAGKYPWATVSKWADQL